MTKKTPKRWTRFSDFIEELQSGGRYTFSLEEASRDVEGSYIGLQSAIRRLKRKGRLVSPRRGFFIIVPLEYRSTGAPPPSWFIDDLMRYVKRPYYVGLLSAAAVHGAAHQHAQVFQVLTNLPMTPLTAGKGRVEFFRKRSIEKAATARVKTETGYMTVSTPETTVFDLIRHVHAVGHLSNVATVLSELGEGIDPGKLVEAASLASLPEVRRAGYLFQFVGKESLAAMLEKVVTVRWEKPSRLRQDTSADGAAFDKRWSLYINETVEPDI